MKVKSWCPDIEDGAMRQIENLSQLPFVYKHIAIMPDCHQGYGMPIGAVLACDKVVIPNAVGVDIGCGVRAVKTPHEHIERADLEKIVALIREKVPVGFNKHLSKQDEKLLPKLYEDLEVCSLEYENALYQIGTLGGGNHFIEIQKGSDGYIWFMIHTGSRNMGYKVCNHYNRIAKELNKKYYSEVKPEMELAFLPTDTEEGMSYIEEMNYCIDYAYANRDFIQFNVTRAITSVVGKTNQLFMHLDNIHNFARLENHFGKNVYVHRKGAITLKFDYGRGIIPGSQGTKSYIVNRKDAKHSFNSCSHGAGRSMSRTKARNELSLENEKNLLDEKGIIHCVRREKDLDEAPSAYKNIDEVMKNQKELVNIEIELTPLAVIKG